MAPFTLQAEQLNSIYGISTTASAIIAEIGIDMKPFKTAEHIVCSWAGLCPGNNESAENEKALSVTKAILT